MESDFTGYYDNALNNADLLGCDGRSTSTRPRPGLHVGQRELFANRKTRLEMTLLHSAQALP